MSARPHRFAAIDLGSNSFHLLLAEQTLDGGYHVVSRQRQKVRLADGLDAQGQLKQAAIDRGLVCLSSFSEFLLNSAVSQVRCVATATLRKASNRNSVLEMFETALGYPIEIISGEDEARFIYRGATQDLTNTDTEMLVLDIGGASTEAITGKGTEPLFLRSLDMGCVIWQNRFFADGEINQDRVNAAVQAAIDLIAPHQAEYLSYQWQYVCGASGAFRALHDILQHRPRQSFSATWIAQVIRDAVQLGHVRELGKLGVRRDRRAVFMGGVTILLALVQQLKIEQLALARGALREGLLQSLLQQAQLQASE